VRCALNNAGVLIVLPAAFFFGGLVQIIVTIMEFSWYHAAGDIIESTFARKVLSFAPRRSGNRTRSPAAARSRSPLDSACHRPYRQVVAHATRRWILLTQLVMGRRAMHGDGDRTIRAAGGVLWRSPASGAAEVALVHRPEYDDWSLPKGKLRRGEHPLVTACREVEEETGVRAIAGKWLEVEHYNTARGPKAVEYWAMRGPDAPFRPTREVDHLAWVPLADTPRLDYQGDAYAIDALAALADSVRSGSAVLLVRNARAVPAGRWHGAAGHRLLDVEGREQAETLRRTLPAFGLCRLLSASEARFVDTMQPLGAELGLAVETEPAFSEEEYAARPGPGLTRILELADAGGTTAVCAPGAVIRHLLATLAEDAGLDVREYPAVKGSVWALFFSGGQLAAADYYPALTSPLP